MTDGQDWSVAVDSDGRRRLFRAAELPVKVGGDAAAGIVIAGLPGTIEIGRVTAGFFVRAGRNARNLRVDGELVTSSRELRHGAVIAFDRARIACAIDGDRLTLGVETLVTAGDTAPPGDVVVRDGVSDLEIKPIAFKPTAPRAARSRRPSNFAIGVGAAVAVLAVIAWYAFTAKSVTLKFEPVAEQVSLPSTDRKSVV